MDTTRQWQRLAWGQQQTVLQPLAEVDSGASSMRALVISSYLTLTLQHKGAHSQVKHKQWKLKASLTVNIHTIFKFLSLNPQRTKKTFPQSSFRMTWLQTCVLSHFKTAFWGRNCLTPNTSYRIKRSPRIFQHFILVHGPPRPSAEAETCATCLHGWPQERNDNQWVFKLGHLCSMFAKAKADAIGVYFKFQVKKRRQKITFPADFYCGKRSS